MKRNTLLSCVAICLGILLAGCSGSSEPLKDLADVYAEIADNNDEVGEAYQAVYSAEKEKQQSLLEKAMKIAEEKKIANEKLVEKAKEIGSKLIDTEISCKASDRMGIEIEKAVFQTVNAQEGLCNIVVKVLCSEPSSKPYCLMMDKDDNILWKTPAAYNDGSIAINFRIVRNRESAGIYGKLNHILVVTEAEFYNKADDSAVNVSEATSETEVTEPVYTGDDSDGNVKSSETSDGSFKVGDNLRAALQSASNVTYEYNADSGIWATIGNSAIVIDEDQLSKQGVDFISTIMSDIAPDIAFKPEYVKSDAKILRIES